MPTLNSKDKRKALRYIDKIHVTNSGGRNVAAVFFDGIGQNGQNRKMSQLLAVGGDDEATETLLQRGGSQKG